MADFRHFLIFDFAQSLLQKNLGFLATGKIGGRPSVRAPLQFLHESIFCHSPSFTATAEKKGWIVSKANKTGQFSIITTTPDARAFHNYLPPLARGTPSFIKKENIQVRPPRRFAPPLQVSPTKHKCVSWGPMGGELTHPTPTKDIRNVRLDE